MSASTPLTTVENLKAYLHLGGEEDDAVLAQLIAAASAAIERYCGRRFGPGRYTEYHDGRGSVWLVLDERPVQEVHDLRDDPARQFGAASVIPPADYALYAEDGIVRRLQGVFHAGHRNVRIDYSAGYDVIPADLGQAGIILAAAWFHAGRQGSDGLRAEALGDYRAEYLHLPLPAAVTRLLEPYRNWQL